MRRIAALSLLIASLWFGAASAQVPLTGAGLAVLGASCTPISAPTGGIYDNATLAGGSTINASVAINQVTSPDCTVDASTIAENSNTGDHQSQFAVTHSFTATTYTTSVYAKYGVGARNITIQTYDNSFTYYFFWNFSLSDCTALTGSYGLNGFSSITSSATVVGSWCKISTSAIGVVSSAYYIRVKMLSPPSTNSYAGDGSSTLDVWGLDLR
jgi:hypothetical protein